MKIIKCNKTDIPQTIDETDMYIATSTTEDFATIYTSNKEWKSKEYVDNQISSFVTEEEFNDTKDKADTAVQPDDLKTINNEPLTGGGNITIDLALFKVVSELPTENINPNKIYLMANTKLRATNVYDEYVYIEDKKEWELIGTYESEVDLSQYLKTEDADKKYMKLDNGSATIAITSNGSMNNFGNNGQAFNAVRDCGTSSITGYKFNAASFGVKLDGTTAFSHKKYDSYVPSSGSYTGAKNTAVLTFSGPTGLRYAKNTGSSSDVTEEMYKYVGVIDSLDENQRVYSAKQVDALIKNLQDQIDELKAQING